MIGLLNLLFAAIGVCAHDDGMRGHERDLGRGAGWSASHIDTSHSLSSDRATGVGTYDPLVQKTFLTWAGPHMDPTVVAFDHNLGGFSNTRVVGDGKQDDHHNYPKMIMNDEDKLIVVWTDHNLALYMSKCSLPHTIDCTWTETKINDDKGTYPTIHKSSSGTLYIFYRRSDSPTDYRPLRYVKSTNHGNTWSLPQKAIDTDNLMPDNLNEVYSDGLRYEPAHDGIEERFLLGWTMAGGGPVHEHNVYHKDAYFAYFYPSTDTFASVDGTDLGATIDYADMSYSRVFDSGPINTSNKQIMDYYYAPSYLDGTGNAILLYNYDDTLMSATWTGSSWTHTVVKTNTGGLFDIEKVGPQDFDVFHMNGGGVRIQSTGNAGATWAEEELVQPPQGSFGKVFKIPGCHPDIELLAVENNWAESSFEGIYKVWIVGSSPLSSVPPPTPTIAPVPTPTSEYLVNDNFDSYTTGGLPGGGWTVDVAGGTVIIAEAPGTGDKSVKLEDTTTTDNVSCKHSFPAQSGTVTAEFRVLMPVVSNSFNIALTGSGGTAVSIFVRTNPDQLAYRIGSTYYSLKAMSNNIWYTIKLVVNVATKKCDIYIDGELKGDQTDFRESSVTDVSSLKAATSNANQQTGYFDDAQVYLGSGIEPTPAPVPTQTPRASPTDAPTEAPTQSPTAAPTEAPTNSPTDSPTPSPTLAPTPETSVPTSTPTLPPQILVNDDFESYLTGGSPGGGWSIDNAGGFVTIDEVPNASGKSVKLEDTTTTDNVSCKHSFPAQSGTVTAEFRVMMPTVSNSFNIALTGSGGTAVSIFARNNPDHLAYRIGLTYYYLQAMSNNIWYSIKLVANVAAERCDIYVDGVLKGGQTDFREPVTDISSLKAATSNANQQIGYFDDAQVYIGSGLGPTPSPMIQSPTASPSPAQTAVPTPLPVTQSPTSSPTPALTAAPTPALVTQTPTLSPTPPPTSASTVLLQDNFYAYTVGGPPGGGWTVDQTGGSVKIVTVNVFGKGVELSDTSRSENVECEHSFPTQTGRISAEFMVMMPSVKNFFSIDLHGSNGVAMRLFIRRKKFAHMVGSSTYYLQEMTGNIWYHVKLVANISAQKGDIYIDDTLVAQEVDFQESSATEITSFRVATSDAKRQTGYIGDVKVAVS